MEVDHSEKMELAPTEKPHIEFYSGFLKFHNKSRFQFFQQNKEMMDY